MDNSKDIDSLATAATLDKNQDALESLLKKLQGKITGLAYHWIGSLHGYEVEDLQQIACQELYHALDTWEPGQGTFRSWFITLVTNRYTSMHREQMTQKRGKGLESVSLSEPAGIDADGELLRLGDILRNDSQNPEDIAVFNLTLEALLKTLSPIQRRIYDLLIDGYTVLESAAATSLTPDQVKYCRKQIRAHLQSLKDS